MSTLKFVPFSSAAEAGFWHALSSRKVDDIQLSEEPQMIWGHYDALSHGDPLFSVDYNSFGHTQTNAPHQVTVPGTLHLVNTMEAFKNMDRVGLFNSCSTQLWRDCHGFDPNVLARFMVVAYADLKKFKFYYWFAFPGLTMQPMVNLEKGPRMAVEILGNEAVETIHQAVNHELAFLITQKEGSIVVKPLSSVESESDFMLGVIDPTSRPQHPGWPARNALTWLRVNRPDLRSVGLFCLREKGHDVIFSVSFEKVQNDDFPGAVGWEKNSQGKLAPRMIDLAAMMNPSRLAETGVDLNLRLMRWRLLPEVNLEKLASTKVLVFGAGTVGCAVARVAMGWGIRNITFVDSGRVSYSNPVRQSLYEFSDCVDGGVLKAPAAAKKLELIFPGAVSTGHVLQIPMPGHHVDDRVVGNVKKDVDRLIDLINNNDVVFLTTDSRESRWLPTMLCSLENKVCINVALGFDSYVVMRHGVPEMQDRLGCYFCNDVVAPSDSQTDRTLDQQCTVTRPGVSYIASALAVELMVSILHHEDGPAAPATDTTPLGAIPHQIRGYLAQFNDMIITGQSYSQCTACSAVVLSQYQDGGFDFLLKVFNNSTFLEDITGLTELHRKTEELVDDADFEWDSEDGLL